MNSFRRARVAKRLFYAFMFEQMGGEKYWEDLSDEARESWLELAEIQLILLSGNGVLREIPEWLGFTEIE